MRRRPVHLVVMLVLAAAACAANPPLATVVAEQSVAEPNVVGPTTTIAAPATTLTAEPPSTTIAAVAPSTTSSTVAPRDGVVTMAFSGDVLIHRPIVARALAYGGGDTYDFAPMFARIKPLLSSVDLAVCHLETPVAPPGEPLSGHPIYGIPREIAPALAATGFDRCSTASNHTLDRGLAGIDATVDALEQAGIGSSGMARTPEESEPRVFTVNGIRISQLAYTWGFNGIPMPKGNEWRAKLLNANRIVADAQVARARGAEYVFVNLHWGQERSWRITDEQRTLARTLTASGAVDLVVGEHVHVLQPIEQVNGRWVVYGMSNLISNLPGGDTSWPASSQDGAIFTLTVSRLPGGGFETSTPVVHPTWVDHDGYLVRLALPDIADPSTPSGTVVELRRSVERTRQVLGDYVPAA